MGQNQAPDPTRLADWYALDEWFRVADSGSRDSLYPVSPREVCPQLLTH